MFVCQGAEKENRLIKRKHYSVQLHGALLCLFRFYTLNKKASAQEIESLFGVAAENIVQTHSLPQGRIQLAQLLKAREIHRYIGRDPEWRDVKYAVLQCVLRKRSFHASWVLVRNLLLAHCQGMFPATQKAGEGRTWIDMLSDVRAPLTELLTAVAAFYFDQDEERPPANWMVHFPNGHFPQYWWRVLQGGGQNGSRLVNQEAWHPQNPYCRWAWLAMDLHHHIAQKKASPPASDVPHVPPATKTTTAPPAAPARAIVGSQSPEQVFCRFSPSNPTQLELLSLEGLGFAANVQRFIHQQFGADGVRLYATLLAQLAANTPDQQAPPIHLKTCAQNALPTLANASKAKLKQVEAKLQRIVKRLGKIELIEIQRDAAQEKSWCEHTALLSIKASGKPFAPTGGNVMASIDQPDEHLTLELSPVLRGTSLLQWIQCYARIPQSIWKSSPTEHPFALGLWVFGQAKWQGQAAGSSNQHHAHSWQTTSRDLLEVCGCWFSASSQYRALEILKKELYWLAEQGLLAHVQETPSPHKAGLEILWTLQGVGSKLASTATQPKHRSALKHLNKRRPTVIYA